VRSSRQIERLCERDIGFRVITANQAPDHSTIARFRQANEEALAALFTQVLRLCAEAGLVKVGVVALDGTKMKANASLAANRRYASIEREVRRMMEEAEAKDAEEDELYGPDRRGDELPEELQDRRKRLTRLKEAQARLEREAAAEAAKQAEKIAQRAEEEEKSGHKKRGRKPKQPDDMPQAGAKANVTDPESRIMKTRTGHLQGYNGQAVVTKDQVIVAADVTQAGSPAPLGRERCAAVTPDAGANTRGTICSWGGRRDGRCGCRCWLLERMERKLRTKRGWGLYSQRGWMVEPVFGHAKDVRRCDRFMRRGHSAARSEWRLIAATHNLLTSSRCPFGELWRSSVVAWA